MGPPQEGSDRYGGDHRATRGGSSIVLVLMNARRSVDISAVALNVTGAISVYLYAILGGLLAVSALWSLLRILRGPRSGPGTVVAVVNLAAVGAATWVLLSCYWGRLSEALQAWNTACLAFFMATVLPTAYGVWRIIHDFKRRRCGGPDPRDVAAARVLLQGARKLWKDPEERGFG